MLPGKPISGGTDMDNKLYPHPLPEVWQDIAADLERTPRGRRCAGCGKPFNAARKWRRVARATFQTEAGEIFSWSWMICRKCALDANHNNTLPDHMKREAEQEAALLIATPGGTA